MNRQYIPPRCRRHIDNASVPDYEDRERSADQDESFAHSYPIRGFSNPIYSLANTPQEPETKP